MTITKKEKVIRNQYLWRYVVFCATGVLLNLIPSYIVGKAGIPLWMDTIGTILTAVLGGYLPGIFVGFVTNLIKGFTDITSIYYAALNVLISVCATFMSNRGWLKKVHTTLLFVLCLAIVGGGLGGILPWLLSGFPTNGFIIDFGIDILDKLITVGIVLLVLHFIPEEQKRRLVFRGWQQRPLTEEEEKESQRIKCRRISVRGKILMILIVSLLLLATAATLISYILYHNSMQEEYSKIASNVANMASNAIDANRVDEFIEKGESAEGYLEIEEELYRIRNAAPDVEYLYAYKILEDGCHVVFDLDVDGLEGAEAGELVPFDESFTPLLPKLLAGEEIEPITTNDSFGWLLTAYVPLRNDAGECVCYIGTDVAMTTLLHNELSFIIQMIFLFAGFVVLILAISVWFVDYGIIFPVNSMALHAQDLVFDKENDEEEISEEKVDSIRRVDIGTGDEIENLYHSILNVAENNLDFVKEINKQSETISQMQTALIMVLADLVENRDENTGQHIRKTATYVEIILKRMKAEGLHADVLTDEYISNVVKSAPLHDIGKIQVPDAVLNKPGKLDDMEFEIMKTHTTAGKIVIEQVIKEVPESGYLNHARDIAYYHHEKWNGRGYPCGLSGEEIPLSARVMAVADVFDALVSKRIYKAPMPLDKAFGIIEKDAGSHFDPDVAKAFLDSEDEIRDVEKMFRDMYGSQVE